MYWFRLVFGFGMMILFGIVVLVGFGLCASGGITGVQLLLLFVCSLGGCGLSCELWIEAYRDIDNLF